jgi:hypothetical protein
MQRFVRLGAAIQYELTRLAGIQSEAEQALGDFAERVPPLRELRGIGDILHDFYTGAERIFEKIAPELNGGLPAGPMWHRELLNNMALELPGIRPAVIQQTTARKLEEFLRFRHLFRNLYGFELEWSKLKLLLQQLPTTMAALRGDLERFTDFLMRAGQDQTTPV